MRLIFGGGYSGKRKIICDSVKLGCEYEVIAMYENGDEADLKRVKTEEEARRVFDSFVEKRRPPIKNKPSIFGRPLLIDENDEICGEEEILLINAASISLEEAFSEVVKRGGVCYPAHIDRSANGIISMLGDFPPEPRFTAFELNDIASLDECRAKYPILTERGLVHLQSSDAHYLTDISENGFPIEIADEPYSSALVRNKLIDYLLGYTK